MLVMGTGLNVLPFNMLVREPKKGVPVVLINLADTKMSFRFKDTYNHPDRLFLEGKCDEIIAKLMKDIGWKEIK